MYQKKLSRHFGILLFLMVSLLFGIKTAESAGEKRGVTVFVELSPAGSFEVTGNRFRGGKLAKSGGGFAVTSLSVKSKDLKTGLDLRDEHMRKRLGEEVIIHQAKGLGGSGKGMIEINKVKKEFNFSYKPATDKLLEVTFQLKLTDFNITDVNYMGVGVKDNVKIKALVPISE